MKKLIFIFFLALSNLSWAAARDPIQIDITNSLDSDCILKEFDILYGHMSDHTKIPAIIHPNQTVSFKMRSGPRYRRPYIDKAITLTYRCNTEQEITLFTSANNNDIDTKRLAVKGMWANSDYQSIGFYAATIHWELTY